MDSVAILCGRTINRRPLTDEEVLKSNLTPGGVPLAGSDKAVAALTTPSVTDGRLQDL